ncbi:conjugative transposon protein TraM [Flavisolibacter nicotianae]|uniref:conjugative transposon protein TraM n=1 Tax=Flavisolibacter nicotianae TaxID=2364882 RepID=UPI000EAE88E5|nr:conjugative transposon protein TraM [Flavisolibacter nicotianae]
MNVQLTNLQRQQRALLVLPLLVVPLLTLAFWAMGGGLGENANPKEKSEGLNLQLPQPALGDDKDKTKLSFYEAQKRAAGTSLDTAAMAFYGLGEPAPGPTGLSSRSAGELYNPAPPGLKVATDPNEARVYQKLAELNKALANPSPAATPPKRSALPVQDGSGTAADINRLAAMMGKGDPKSEPDPELDRLNGMMEKILDIQHPERVQRKQVENEQAKDRLRLPLQALIKTATVSCLDTGLFAAGEAPQGFYSLSSKQKEEKQNAIEAAVYQSQTLVDGAVITFRLLADVVVKNTRISKGSLVSGTCSQNAERLNIQITSIRQGSSLFPVKLTVYDLDGIQGIYIPGIIARDIAKATVDNAAQMLQLSSLDPSLKSQATSAGIGAVKSLLSQKVKQVAVQVKSGYRVLLVENAF